MAKPGETDRTPGRSREGGAPRRLARKLRARVEQFAAIEAASGIVLIAASALALAWANSPWRAAYSALWHLPLGIRLGSLSLGPDLHFWVNDGLMTIFFFVVGLEIRKEIHQGELSDLRRAALPIAGAVGGMVVPAAIFLAFNSGHASARGWGIPMATDIAFALGVLTLLGTRVAPSIRVLLLALAIIDDVGVIIIIAVFYSSGLAWAGVLPLGAGLVVTLSLRTLRVATPWAYVAPGLLVWVGAYGIGVHPTLAGVVLGMLTPVRGTSAGADEQEGTSPADRLLHALHGWVAFGAMPLFALANAGVGLGSVRFDGDGGHLALGVALGLVLGKPLGVLGAAWLMAQLGLVVLPAGVRWVHVALVGVVAGIGFTMGLFIAELAFPPGPSLELAKLAILGASAVAATGALVFGRMALATS